MRRALTILSHLLALCALCALTGCGGESPSGSTTTGGTGGTGGTTASGGTGGTTTSGGTGGTTASGGTGGTGGTGGMAVCGDGLLQDEACDDGDTDSGDGCDSSCAVETGYACAGEPSDCTTICGDGLLAGAETCDDANADAGDGCDASCAVETGYECSGAPSACDPTCGDGIVAGPETCDDGDIASGDGCDDACALEPGWVCDGMPTVCDSTCGDGIVAGVEVCDDANIADGDGCTTSCAVEDGWACAGAPSACATTCGDGVGAGTEACDDANTASGDGCDAACGIEDGWVCTGEPSACATVCGDGIQAGAETCDDADSQGGDGCSAACLVESGYACAGAPSACATICGDGLIVAAEACDDGNPGGGDGCGAACAVEAGWTCIGAPSACATTCGDGIVAGAETCDDTGAASGDGCTATCLVEAGYYCTGTPSACVTQCGDGIKAGSELCDDGNQVAGDGCSPQCTPNTGETCADPLVAVQAVQNGAQYTWTVASGAVTTADGAWACDPNGTGPDVVVKYTKTSDTLANGGMLLHVKADTPSASTTTYYLDLEIKAGACMAGSGASLKCDWYKDNWDSYLDVPAGDYWIWIAKNSAATAAAPFPQVTVLAEEVAPAAAQGEGCFAPYTSASPNYTPPGGPGQPHAWTIADGAINSFDMGPTWGAPGSISCDNTAPYGDIHGVDAVIDFDKQSATSVLKIDVQNNDPVLTQSALNVEVLSVCDATSPTKISRNCRANKDTFSITAPAPAGSSFVWLSTEATGQELNGATVQITEIFPGIGESWPTAQPLLGSGPITATSAQRLDAPSCFPAAGNIHWFSYTLTNDAFSLGASAAGVIGVYNGAGQELACVTDASTSSIGLIGDPGQIFYIAVQSPTPIASFVLQDITYTGVQGNLTDMLISFPTSPLSEYGMAANAGQLVMGDTSSVFSFPATVGATALEYGAANGITATHLGYDLVFAGGSLFSVDNTTAVNVSRLFRVYDGVTWGPGTPWDLTPSYPSTSPSHAIATDGTTLFLSTRRTTANTDVSIYSLNPAVPGTPVLLGVKSGVWYVTGMAVDATYFYFASNGSSGEGVYRVQRANLAAPAVKIATIDTGTLCNNIEVDDHGVAKYLYVRDALGNVHAVVDPGSATSVHIGAISTLGTSSDFAMTYDASTSSLYLFETETDAAGRIVRLQ